MQRMKLILTFALGALASALAAPDASAEDSAMTSCFVQHQATRVLPYEVDRVAGEGTYTALVGARVFVQAEPGLTAEWLDRQLLDRISQRQANSSCPLDLQGVAISVQSGGPGFWVNISAASDETAKEVLRRSQRLTAEEARSR